jgi:PAS domain-containing protein
VFKASRGIEDIYELTYIRKDGSRFPAVVSVTALRDAQDAIIGYLLIGTDNTARKQVEAEQKKLDQRLRDQQFYTRSLIESNIDALMTTDPAGIITDVNKQMEALTGLHPRRADRRALQGLLHRSRSGPRQASSSC